MNLNKLVLKIQSWPRRTKKVVMTALDLLAVGATCILLSILEPSISNTLLAVYPFVTVAILYAMRVHKITVSRIGHQSGLRILFAVIASGVLFYAFTGYERGTVLYTSLSFFAVSGWRFIWSYMLPEASQKNMRVKRVAIYGAGEAGIQVASSLRKSKEYDPICFFDDDPELRKQIILDLPVYHGGTIQKILDKKNAELIILAMPSVARSRRNEILKQLQNLNVKVQTIPGLIDIVSGRSKISELKEIDPLDLLGRDPIDADESLLTQNVKDKSVLVTGAGGSIGSELCRQINEIGAKRLVLYEMTELSLYKIYTELKDTDHGVEIIPVLGNVQDRRHIQQVIEDNNIETLYHAAAYKHVPLVEFNLLEGIKNNVFGTLNTARAAVEAGAETFVLISTDKAVRPSNVMGATKRVAEKIIQSLSRLEQKRTKFCFVRFGNVLDSSGSVIPLFRSQIERGGPVTVTDPEITRYFMSIPEAVRLVLQAGALAEDGDALVLDMGEPVKIIDLAKQMIKLSGLEPKTSDNQSGDIDIQITGLRPGEKLHEELFVNGDNCLPTAHQKILRERRSGHTDFNSFDKQIKILEKAIFNGERIAYDSSLFDLIEPQDGRRQAA